MRRDTGALHSLEESEEKVVKEYFLYKRLKEREDKVRPIIPLEIVSKERKADIGLVGYEKQLQLCKDSAISFLYGKGVGLLEEENRFLSRVAYQHLSTLNSIDPEYKNTAELLQIAEEVGKSYVLYNVSSKESLRLSRRFLRRTQNIRLKGLNNKWKEYHTTRKDNIEYDYMGCILSKKREYLD